MMYREIQLMNANSMRMNNYPSISVLEYMKGFPPEGEGSRSWNQILPLKYWPHSAYWILWTGLRWWASSFCFQEYVHAHCSPFSLVKHLSYFLLKKAMFIFIPHNGKPCESGGRFETITDCIYLDPFLNHFSYQTQFTAFRLWNYCKQSHCFYIFPKFSMRNRPLSFVVFSILYHNVFS